MGIFKNRVVIGITCLILAILVGFVVVPTVNNITSQTVEVVRVKEDVKIGTQITDEMVEMVEIGKKNLPGNPFSATSKVVGLYAVKDMDSGDIVYDKKVAKTITLPEARVRAMSSNEKTYDLALSGNKIKFLPNDIVTFYEIGENGEVNEVPELKYVSVVCQTTKDGAQILTADQVGTDGKAMEPEYMKFIVTDTQILKLLSLESTGNYKIALAKRASSTTDAELQRLLSEQDSILNSAVKKAASSISK